jgi:hypothetical protein
VVARRLEEPLFPVDDAAEAWDGQRAHDFVERVGQEPELSWRKILTFEASAGGVVPHAFTGSIAFGRGA